MKRNGETVEYQVTLNIPHLRGKNQQNLRESPCFLREWRSSDRSWLSQRTCLSLCGGSRETGLPSQSRSARQGRVAAPSVCFAAARILLAAAPTAPPCFRHWRRSSPLPQRGSPWHVGQLSSGRAKRNVSEAAVLRCLGQRQLDKERCPEAAVPVSKARPFASCRASVVQWKVIRPAKASPSGGGVAVGDGEGYREFVENARVKREEFVNVIKMRRRY